MNPGYPAAVTQQLRHGVLRVAMGVLVAEQVLRQAQGNLPHVARVPDSLLQWRRCYTNCLHIL